MEIAIIIGLIAAGLILLLLEILVIPGTGVVGIIGLGLIAFSVYVSFRDHGTATGFYVSGATLVSSVALVWISLRSNTWKKLELKSEIGGKVNTIDESAIKVGDTGITVSRLAPMGKAIIENEQYEVISSTGLFLDENSKVKIVRIDGNKIYVKEVVEEN